MKKVLILIIILITIFSFFLSAYSVKGNLPYMNQGERYEDPFFPSSELTPFIYYVFSTPYSLTWLEEYVDDEIIPTFLTYYQEDVSELTQSDIIGITINYKESYSIVKIDFEIGVRVETMWRKNEEQRYVMFSLNKII